MRNSDIDQHFEGRKWIRTTNSTINYEHAVDSSPCKPAQ